MKDPKPLDEIMFKVLKQIKNLSAGQVRLGRYSIETVDGLTLNFKAKQKVKDWRDEYFAKARER